MALFSIKELQSMKIIRNDLEWNRAFVSIYRGIFRLPRQSEPTQVAMQLWSKELNASIAIGFLRQKH